MIFNFDTFITKLPGVGDKRAALLARLGITNVGQLLRHFPRGYQNRGDVREVSEGVNGEIVSLVLTVGNNPVTSMLRSRMFITKFMAFDDSGKCNIVFFNNRYASQTFSKGSTFRFYGKCQKTNGRLTLTNPIFERVVEGSELPPITSIYPLTSGLSQKIVSNLVSELLMRMDDSAFKTSLSDEIMQRADLCTPAFAYRAIHCPKSFEDTEKARRFFVFEELYNFALRVKHSKALMREGRAEVLKVGKSTFTEFTSQFSYELTNAQKKAVNEIAADLASGKPMRRMLCGDVGSGKTAVAAAAAYIAIKSGHKAALMAPTEILASQHYADLSSIFDRLGIRCALFVGSNSQKTKKELYRDLKNGDIDLAIGTHALLSEAVEFNDCALVITDEQHRFGVNQRDTLEKKGNESQGEDGDKKVHTLVMSATPIPRSLAQTVYGDLDLSILDELPPGRKSVDTFVVGSDYLTRLDKFIEKQVKEGSKVYVVCPAVEEKANEDSDEVIQFGYGYDAEQIANESLPIIGAVEEAERLKKSLPELEIGCVHGKMKSGEKEEIMKAFSSDGLDVLVSTTVIEVGVNVPTATLMIVRCAERFGLSQLHQLRGRVGRGDRQSFCVLVSDSASELSRERLNAIKSTSDGFMLAEHDLALRGPGDFIQGENGSVRQSGDFRFRFASLTEDIALMKLAFEFAE